ncbi:H/ACA ribonucleoprotein complex non-core subunit NAF1 [Chionoecetes opilio]|uniref:H/ACA ribonucleoprotein complex subunit n=1 Tax=Chionoecetes opilio TaxID=41210 RepID=A0A8J4Y9V8_CHIOP|nr:H/ACA ribonucleoprotein complex non-core subunit NAF1 [Chionoecetes opilio]
MPRLGSIPALDVSPNAAFNPLVVESLPNLPPLDLDSVLFVGPERRSLGLVFDVFGPVAQPLYVVRFNSAEHVAESGALPGEEVFFAPASDQHTHYVLLDELLRCRGSDASGLQGNELGPGEISDFSDDEEEARARRRNRAPRNGPRVSCYPAQSPLACPMAVHLPIGWTPPTPSPKPSVGGKCCVWGRSRLRKGVFTPTSPLHDASPTTTTTWGLGNDATVSTTQYVLSASPNPHHTHNPHHQGMSLPPPNMPGPAPHTYPPPHPHR